MALTSLTSPVGTELTDFSPSRLSTAGQCGRKFEFGYVRRLPQPYDKGALLLGDAFHNGVEQWYGPPEDGDAFRERSLPAIVCAQWEKLLPPAVWIKVQHLRDLDEECKNVLAAIRFKRPDLKSDGSTTVEFLKSDAGKAYNEARAEMLVFCDLLPDVKWPKDEDPYKAYSKAAGWAALAEARWKDKPRPLLVEGSFIIELFGYRVRGRIDALRCDPMPTGEALLAVVDYKTGRQPLTQMEAFLQSFIYYKAVEMSPELPTTDRVAFYQTRKEPTPWQQGRIDPARHSALASRIFHDRARKIAMAQFAPEPGFWCKSCDFNDLCQNEISLWQGETGLIAELMA